jgi:hypothetical protein
MSHYSERIRGRNSSLEMAILIQMRIAADTSNAEMRARSSPSGRQVENREGLSTAPPSFLPVAHLQAGWFWMTPNLGCLKLSEFPAQCGLACATSLRIGADVPPTRAAAMTKAAITLRIVSFASMRFVSGARQANSPRSHCPCRLLSATSVVARHCQRGQTGIHREN